MFSGRKKELKYLQNRYESNKSEFVVLYGRRRIGKTELLKQFALDKNHIFYSAIETVDKSQLEMFSKELLKGSELENYIDSFKSWEEAFKFLADKSKKRES